jgi:hypothetical protein
MSGDLQVKRKAKKERAEKKIERGADHYRREEYLLGKAERGEWIFHDNEEMQEAYDRAMENVRRRRQEATEARRLEAKRARRRKRKERKAAMKTAA